MWSWHPRPWQHSFDFALMFGGVGVAAKVPAVVPNEAGMFIGVVLGTTLIVCGGAVWVASNVAMVFDKREETIRNARMFAQPTEEEKNVETNRIQRVAEKLVKTGGNTPTVIDMAPGWAEALAEVKREVPEAFKGYQNTAQVIGLAEVDNAVKKICRRTLTLVEHKDLGFPDGDFREATWVVTKEMTRKSLLLAIGILERHGGIERKGNAKNATYGVKDLEVIKRGARTPLPHPLDCWCSGCAQK